MVGFNTTENEYKGERGRLFPFMAKGFDILVLQEAFYIGNPRFWDFVQNLNKVGFSYYCKSPLPRFQCSSLVDGGLFIASKFPIEHSEFQEFKSGIQIDSLLNKGLLYAQIKIDDYHLHVFNIHTQASYSGHHIDIQNVCIIQRLKELLIAKRKMKQILKERFKEKDCVTLSGDFNLDARLKTLDLKPILKLLHSDKHDLKLPKMESVYDIMIFLFNFDNDIFEVLDIYYQEHKEHPISFADTKIENGIEVPRDVSLTDPEELMRKECLDYIFRIQMKKCDSRNFIFDKSKVEHFFVDDQPFTQISDHYGLSFEIKKRQFSLLNYLSQFYWSKI